MSTDPSEVKQDDLLLAQHFDLRAAVPKLKHLGDLYDYSFMVVSPSAYTIADQAWTRVRFNTVVFDPKGMWNNTDKSWKVPFSGLWRVEGGFRVEATQGIYRYIARTFATRVDASTDEYRMLDARNGGSTPSPNTTPAQGGGMIAGREVYLEKDSVVLFETWHNIGSTRNYPVTETTGNAGGENFLYVRCVRRFDLIER